MRVILMGPPGTGKGTQARRLSLELGVPHISTGDLFRGEIAAGTPLGKEVERGLQQGRYAPDEIVLQMISNRLAQADCAVGFVFDGFPRTVPQAESLDRLLSAAGRTIDSVLYLDTPFDEIRRRASERRVCSKPDCQEVYGVQSRPPKVEGVCDRCGSPVVQRPDDRPETVEKRLSEFQKKTAAVADYYKARDLLRSVDGTAAPDAVFERIRVLLGRPSRTDGRRRL